MPKYIWGIKGCGRENEKKLSRIAREMAAVVSEGRYTALSLCFFFGVFP